MNKLIIFFHLVQTIVFFFDRNYSHFSRFIINGIVFEMITTFVEFMNEFIKIWNIKNALIMQITTTEMITVDFGEANGDRKNKNNLKIVKRENN